MSFDSLGLSAELIRAVLEKGYSKPTSIQIQSIPVILKGLDIMGRSQTGTGKTAGFTLPLLQLLNKHSQSRHQRSPRALILTPTRELAAQVAESVNTYGKYLSLKSTTIFGGVNIKPQIAKLRRGVDILVATPGRLLDHANQKTIDLSKRLFDLGYVDTLQATIVIPYPGTPLFRECKKNGWLVTSNWDEYDQRMAVMKSPLTEKDIKEMTQELYKSFMTPKFVLRKILSIRTWSDITFLFRAAGKVLGHLVDFSSNDKSKE